MSLHVGMVAGEPSGDLIAGRIIPALRQRSPGIEFEGIGGPSMTAAGMNIWHPMHALSVFGYVDALRRLPSLLGIYRDVKQRWLKQPPSVFVGVDAPDFNLKLERQLRQAGTPTVHLVGPSIWAWRYERIHAIREAVSHMLVLFPFEVDLYRKEGVPVTYVGHPLASAIPMRPDRAAARAVLGVDQNARVLAILPGSRSSEIRIMGPRFLQAAQQVAKRDPGLQFLVPMVNAQRRAEFEQLLRAYPVPGLRIVAPIESSTPGQPGTGVDAAALSGGGGQTGVTPSTPIAWQVLAACSAVLVASGTATLEAALFKRPMVISYVLSPWMRRIMSWKSGQQRPLVPWIGLPNVLLRDFVVPEILQDEATPETLAAATWQMLCDDRREAVIEARFGDMHAQLHQDTGALAARAIQETIDAAR